MKKSLLLLTALSAFSSVSHAQKMYVKIGLGHNIPVSGSAYSLYDNPINGKTTYNSITGAITDYELKKSGISSGMQAIAGAGIMFSKYVGIELNATIGFLQKKNESLYAYPYDGAYVSERNTSYAKAPLMLNPSLVLRTPGEKANMYARAGFVLPVMARIKDEYTGTVSDGGMSYTYEGENIYKTYFSLGFSGAMGISVKASKKMNVWAEANLTSLSVFVKEREVTAYYVAGVDVLPRLSANEKKVSYSKKYENVNTRMSYTLPFSNAGVNAGVSFNL
ncbi:MAG TPA: hypothetical protein VGD89_00955 [Flavipsychrobacter sp.]